MCLISSIYVVFFDQLQRAWVYTLILLVGLGSGMILGFTPLIFLSGPRVLIFGYFAFILCSLALYDRIADTEFKGRNVLIALLCFTGLFSYVRYVAMLVF